MLFCLFPFYWLINTSLKTGADLSGANIVPPHPNLDNYSSIFRNGDFTRALLNSAVLGLTTTVIALTVGSFAAYALARLRFPMKYLLLAVILSITTFPPIAVAAPIYKLWSDIGLYDQPFSLGHSVQEVRRLAMGEAGVFVLVDLVEEELVRVLEVVQHVEAQAARLVMLRVNSVVLDYLEKLVPLLRLDVALDDHDYHGAAPFRTRCLVSQPKGSGRAVLRRCVRFKPGTII